MSKNLSATKPAPTPTINAECGYCNAGLAVRGDGTYPYLTRNGKSKLVFCNHEHRVAWANNHCEHCDASALDTDLPVKATIESKCLKFCSEAHFAAFVAEHSDTEKQ